jgi:hypothetical protein
MELVTLTTEVWKDIPEYEGLYQISNLGRVKSFQRNRELILKSFKNRYGYHQVDLSKNKKGKSYTNHRLVMLTFKLDVKSYYDEVNHIDGNKENNHIDNLEWCTRSENIQHAYDNELRTSKGENNARSKLTEIQVKKIRFYGKNQIFNQSDLSKMFNVNTRSISNIILNKSWKHVHI